MSAKVIQEGFVTAGFDQSGEMQKADVAIVLGEVPSLRGEWMFVIQNGSFCWVKGLPKAQGYYIHQYPLEGDTSTWQGQIKKYVELGVPYSQTGTLVPVGTKSALDQEDIYIISE